MGLAGVVEGGEECVEGSNGDWEFVESGLSFIGHLGFSVERDDSYRKTLVGFYFGNEFLCLEDLGDGVFTAGAGQTTDYNVVDFALAAEVEGGGGEFDESSDENVIVLLSEEGFHHGRKIR